MKPIKLKELLRTAKDPATQRIVIDEGLWFDAPLFEGVVKDFVWVSAIIKETVRVDNCQWNSFTVWAKYVSLVPPFINRMVEIVLVAYLHDCDRFVCDVEKSLCVLWHRLTTPL